MKQAILLFFFIGAFLFCRAQNEFQLAAQRGSKTRLHRTGAAVKILYRGADTIEAFKGRIAAVTADSIVLRPFRKSSDYRLSVAVTQLESVRKVRRTARAVTGFLAVIAAVHGIALIADDNKDHSELLDGLEAGLGVTLMLLGGTCYIVTAATETVSKSSKGYRFSVVREK